MALIKIFASIIVEYPSLLLQLLYTNNNILQFIFILSIDEYYILLPCPKKTLAIKTKYHGIYKNIELRVNVSLQAFLGIFIV